MADEQEPVDEEETDIDEENAEGEEGDSDGKKGGKKKLLLIIVPVLLLIGGGAGAYFTGMLDSLLGVEKVAEGEEGEYAEGEGGHEKDSKDSKKSKKDKSKKAKKGKKGGKEGKDEIETAFLALPSMRVNLNTEDGTPRYLLLTVQLELEDPEEKEAVKLVIPRVIDQFQTYLRELRVRDLRGSAGIYRLQMELLWRVNQATDPIEIKDVLFQEILIQ